MPHEYDPLGAKLVQKPPAPCPVLGTEVFVALDEGASANHSVEVPNAYAKRLGHSVETLLREAEVANGGTWRIAGLLAPFQLLPKDLGARCGGIQHLCNIPSAGDQYVEDSLERRVDFEGPLCEASNAVRFISDEHFQPRQLFNGARTLDTRMEQTARQLLAGRIAKNAKMADGSGHETCDIFRGSAGLPKLRPDAG